MSRVGTTVTCDDCQKSGTISLPRVELLGQSVVYTDEDDPESMFLLFADSAVCHDCLEGEIW